MSIRAQPYLFAPMTDEWPTPQDFFDALNDEFQFDLDPCATPDNHKCVRYFTAEDDGLTQDWTGIVFMNPPYGRETALWVQKAYLSARAGATVVCLLPVRTDNAWFHDYCLKGEVRFVRGRLKFNGVKDAPFSSMVVVFKPE